MFTKKSPVASIIEAVVGAVQQSVSASGTIARGAVVLAMRPDADASDACSKLVTALRTAGLTGAGYESNIKRVFRAHPDDLDAVWNLCETAGIWPSMQTLFREYPEAFPTKGDGRGKRAKPVPQTEAANDDAANIVTAPRTVSAYMLALEDMRAHSNTIGLSAQTAAMLADTLSGALAVLRSSKPADKPAK